MRSLFWGAVLAAATNLGFVALAFAGHDVQLMYAVVSADNLAAGFASAAFIAFLSSLTNVSFTAVQYAIFSSLMTLLPKTLGGYSGGMVDALGYPGLLHPDRLDGPAGAGAGGVGRAMLEIRERAAPAERRACS
jgi:MFS transporter, PAT family, beta-lactamase induction signal transducer AmpG